LRLWSGRYKRELNNIYGLHGDIARVISENLRLRLTNEQNEQIAKPYTSNPEAYRLYSLGRFHWNMRTEKDLKKSIEEFKQAINKDPNYALAYAALADAYNVIGTYEQTPSAERFLKARDAASKALAIDDTLAEAYVARANVESLYDWEWKSADEDFQEAFKRNPNYAHAHYSYALNYLVPMGRLDEATKEMNRAVEIDPLSLISLTNLGKLYYFKRQYVEAIEKYEEALGLAKEMGASTTTIDMRLSEAYALSGGCDKAIEEEPNLPGQDRARLAELRDACKKSGNCGYWRTRFEQVKKDVAEGYDSPTAAAASAAMAEEKDLAFKYLEDALKAHDEWLTRLKADPMYDKIRSDSRFEYFVQQVHLEP
jgi:tetratricopeptide (TPR) repeat protein